MSKTANRRKKVQMPAGIRNKMMAAISMLLVSTVMMISSTYAWFTLSTAPEVTGITTNVGANGNLEMMLLTGYVETGADGTIGQGGSYYSGDDNLGVESQVGDSVAHTNDVTQSNITWGNLVDLSDDSYGLSDIVLAPARLNATAGNNGANATIGATMLYAPSYGSDGRVIDVNTATYTGKFDGSTFAYDEVYKGVRVLGTTTDVSQRLAAYREAKASVTVNSNAAKNEATTSLLNNGQSLANILVGYAAGTTTTFTDDDLEVFLKVFNSLDAANEYAAKAIRNAILAYSLSASNVDETGAQVELTDEQVDALQKDIEAVVIESEDSFDSVTNVVTPSTEAKTAISTYLATKNKIAGAITQVNTLKNNDQTEYAYSDISPILNLIVDKTYVEIAGQTDLGKDDIGLVVEEFSAKGSITMTMLNGSGVYADIATMVDNYTVSGLKVHIKYDPIETDVPIVMQTKVSGEGIPQIPEIGLGSAPADNKTQSADLKLSNTYGYALDFGFRTNAAASNLLLQTEAVNRVYTDETNTELNTQGSGSFIQFVSSDVNNFTKEDVLTLMSAVRVAFITPTDTGAELLAVAAADITSETDQTTGITAYTAGDSVSEVNAAGYKSGLFLYEYEVDEESGIISLGKKKDDKSEITALTQNVASKITVIVYLDGDIVDNTMVANANTSMTGSLNLQFSSSATLAPMENTGMRDGGSTGETVVYNQSVLANAGETYEYNGYTGTVNEGYTIYKGSNNVVYFSNDGTNYTKLTINNVSTPITIVSEPES